MCPHKQIVSRQLALTLGLSRRLTLGLALSGGLTLGLALSGGLTLGLALSGGLTLGLRGRLYMSGLNTNNLSIGKFASM